MHTCGFRRLRERETGRWFVVLSGVTENQLTAVGVFTGDSPRAFYNPRLVRSLKGKLLSLRDKHLPGRRIGVINLVACGDSSATTLTVDKMVDDFLANAQFKKRRLYQFCLNIETVPMDV